MRLAKIAAACALALASFSLAAERITPITGQLGDRRTFDAMYIVSQDGLIEATRGRLPIVEHAGKRAMQVKVLKDGDSWSMGISRDWTRFYLADYLPDGVMEVSACGEAGGETFDIGVAQDANRARKTQAHSAVVSAGKYATLTKDWQTVRIPLKDIAAAAPGIDLDDCIKVLVNSTGRAKPQTFYIAEIRFTTTSPETAYAPIKVNQLGYRPAMAKVARISAPVTAFRVVDAATGKAVFSGEAKAFAKGDQASGDDIWDADFTSLTAPGKYRIEADGIAPSDVFEIRDDIYNRLFADAMRFYYLQRCNMALEEKYAGKQAHEACHMGDKQAKTVDGKDTRDVTGGWHDAGDNNKYPAFLANAVSVPLAIYDLRPQAFTDGQLNIPESGNGVPDILDEIQYELDWLLRMQITEGPQAGAVYDRIHQSAAQEGDGAGGKLQEPRRLLPPTKESTAYSTANWAYAARVMSRVPACKEKADRYMRAAELSWQRLQADKVQGEPLLIAALAMFDATGKPEYAQIIAPELDRSFPPDAWIGTVADRLHWATYNTFLCNLAISQHEAMGVREKARRIVKGAADHLAAVSLKDGYGSPLWIMDHYCWSSTADIGRLGYVCLIANQFAPNPDYVRAGENTLHYTLGRNAVALSFVTLYGTRWTEAYHDIYGNSNAAILPMPAGYVPGGVNMQNSRGISAWPAKHYRPDANNWTINEPAIYYNAPLVFLSGYFAELKP